MSFGTPVVGTTAYSASGGTSVAPAYPASVVSTDQLVLILGQKPSAANSGTVTTPSGWTLRESLTAAGGYGTTLGADTGNTNLHIYTKDTVAGGESGTVTVTVGTNGVCWANITRVPTGGGTVSYGVADGQRTTTPTSPLSVALTDGTPATAFQAGDFAIWAMCIPTDVTTPAQFSAHTLTASGVTFNATAELVEPDSTTGNDIGGYVAYVTVATGSGGGAPTVGATLAGTLTNVRGPIALLRMHETAPTVLTGNNSSTNHTSTSGTAGQTHTLAGNSAAQPNTTTSGAVVYEPPATVLTGNSARQDTTGSAGAVGQTHTLGGNSARQDTTGAAGAVGQTHTLAGNAARADTTATTGTVSQTHTLTGASVRQDTSSTAGAVAQTTETVLTGNNARQNTTATGGAAVQTHALTANSARGNTTATSAGVVQTHLLAGASARQNVTTTAGFVTQTHLLAGNSIRQNTTAATGAVTPTHILAGAPARGNTTSTSGAVETSAPPVVLTGANIAQPATCTVGAVSQTFVLVAAPVAVDHIAAASAVVQSHLLTADYVLSAAVQRNTSTAGATYFFSGAPASSRVRVDTETTAASVGATGSVAQVARIANSAAVAHVPLAASVPATNRGATVPPDYNGAVL